MVNAAVSSCSAEMSSSVVFLVCACAVAALAQQYSNKFDSIDLDKILASKRLVNNYVGCLVDKKPCSPEGTELKRVLPDAIKSKCGKCSPQQKQKAVKVIQRLQTDYPAEWKMLTDKWDPKGELMKDFQRELSKEKQN